MMAKNKITKEEKAEVAEDIAMDAAANGMENLAEGADTLDASRTARDVATVAGAAGVQDLTRAEDAGIAAQKMETLSNFVAEAGITIIAPRSAITQTIYIAFILFTS